MSNVLQRLGSPPIREYSMEDAVFSMGLRLKRMEKIQIKLGNHLCRLEKKVDYLIQLILNEVAKK